MTIGPTPTPADPFIPAMNMSLQPSPPLVPVDEYGCAEDDLDGLFTAFVAPEYARHRSEYMDRLRLIYSQDTGRVLLNRLAEIGTRKRVFPVLDFVITPSNRAHAAHPGGELRSSQAEPVVHMENGRCIWDPLSLPLDPASPDYVSQYRAVERYLIALCKQLDAGRTEGTADSIRHMQDVPPAAAEPSRLPPSRRIAVVPPLVNEPVPPAPPRDSSYREPDIAPTTSRRMPELDVWSADPPLPIWTGKTKKWQRVGVHLGMNIRPSKALSKDQLKVVEYFLTEAARTTTLSSFLMRDLAKSSDKGRNLIVAEGNGRSGLTLSQDGTLVWLFDMQDLTRRCTRSGVYDQNRRLCTAMSDLIAAQEVFVRGAGKEFSSDFGRDIMHDFYDATQKRLAPLRAPDAANERHGVLRTYDIDAICAARSLFSGRRLNLSDRAAELFSALPTRFGMVRPTGSWKLNLLSDDAIERR